MKPIEEKTIEELQQRWEELVAKMETLTDRGSLITHSSAILAIEDELRKRRFAK